jgi:hypothetical protein
MFCASISEYDPKTGPLGQICSSVLCRNPTHSGQNLDPVSRRALTFYFQHEKSKKKPFATPSLDPTSIATYHYFRVYRDSNAVTSIFSLALSVAEERLLETACLQATSSSNIPSPTDTLLTCETLQGRIGMELQRASFVCGRGHCDSNSELLRAIAFQHLEP